VLYRQCCLNFSCRHGHMPAYRPVLADVQSYTGILKCGDASGGTGISNLGAKRTNNINHRIGAASVGRQNHLTSGLPRGMRSVAG